MEADVLSLINWASAGIAVAAVGMAAVVIRLVTGRRMSREIDEELRPPCC
ncbi:MAG: hypothetical protein ACE14L_14625 [Terriglobales bacterium]